ncbi:MULTISPECIES: hypothetical protein [Paenibacillus]|uniref:Uncharacterized protein n=1 Tax=Paenibacillus alba TaxID=1197127 RepID=A0ABU6G7R9_9BACL|nr:MULTISPECIES: hypothetical protein [Paenibacillus]MEC0230208.1 hypothetical protein [Paenibacillus alba]NQX68214.1 hypothetical protein [Paenibacillus alba]
MAPPKGKGKVTKKKELSSRVQYTMRLVESSTCAVCKTPCTRGLRYLSMMSQPGALGKGVPCILTRRKVN